MMKRIILLVFVAAALAVPAAWASPPTIMRFPDETNTSVFTDVCASPISLTFVATKQMEMDFTDQNGIPTKSTLEWFEQDTLVGPTGTLVGETMHQQLQILFDNGSITNVWGIGTIAKFRLPDGSFFIMAGRLDYWARGLFLVYGAPDTGRSGDAAALCAALGA